MTPEGVRRLLPVITAFSEGKEVEFYENIRKQWIRTKAPTFCEDHLWRVKPKTLTVFILSWWSDNEPSDVYRATLFQSKINLEAHIKNVGSDRGFLVPVITEVEIKPGD